MNLALVTADGPDVVTVGRTTRNRVVGAPVVITRRNLAGGTALIVNNRISNVAAPGGMDDAETICRTVAAELSIGERNVLPASTGIIGWRLPVREMCAALPDLVRKRANGSALPVAQAIMTTDNYPKLASRTVCGGTVMGVAKGAGMIEPNLATMLVFLFTDLRVPRGRLDEFAEEAIATSFNRISVDGDQSTSDMVIVMSSGVIEPPSGSDEQIAWALSEVMGELAEHVVRNGEGTRHVIRCSVCGAPNAELAYLVGKGVVNSPLVKTAIFGNDPNVGRIVMAVGDALSGDRAMAIGAGAIHPKVLSVAVADRIVYEGGVFHLDAATEAVLSDALEAAMMDEKCRGYPGNDATVDIRIDLGGGTHRTEILGSDLSYGYVHENADYRT